MEKTQLRLDQTTVVEVEDQNGQTNFIQNLKTTVTKTGTAFKFCNPPQFNSIIYTEYSITDSHYKTKAALDHLLIVSSNVLEYQTQHCAMSRQSPTHFESM